MSGLRPLIDAGTDSVPWKAVTIYDGRAEVFSVPLARCVALLGNAMPGDEPKHDAALIVALRNAAAELDALIDAAKTALSCTHDFSVFDEVTALGVAVAAVERALRGTST